MTPAKTDRDHNLPALRPAIGLALGGGAARGIAHIPCLEAIDELGLQPRLVVGTSIGAIIGACYASGLSGAELREFVSKLFHNRADFIRRLAQRWPGSLYQLWNPLTPAILNGETLLQILMPELLPKTFERLNIPFRAIATDFYSEEEVVFSRGALLPAIAASASLPGLMKPVAIGQRVLIDGGFVNPTPFDHVVGNSCISIAIDVTGGTARQRNKREKAVEKRPDKPVLPNSFDAWVGAAQITLRSIQREKLKSQAPDILIRPPIAEFGILDFFKVDDILAAAAPAKEELKRAIDKALRAAG